MRLTEQIDKEYATLDTRILSEIKEKKPSKEFSAFLSAYKKYLLCCKEENLDGSSLYSSCRRNADLARSILFNVSYNQEDITLLCLKGSEYANNIQEKTSGDFFSEAINKDHYQTKTQEPYLIFSEFFKRSLTNVGFENNGAYIKIIGDVGSNLGFYMHTGKISIIGSCNIFTGDNLKGGEILIEGNCGDLTGYAMSSGSIIIEGNSGNNTGSLMRNGSITVKGNIASLAKIIYGGKIYCKDRQVYQK